MASEFDALSLLKFVHQTLPLLIHVPVVLGLVIPSKALSIVSTFPLLLWLVAQAHFREPRPFGEEYGAYCWIMMQVWVWVDWVVLRSPDKEAWHRIDRKSDKKAIKAVRVPRELGERLSWATQLTTNPRMIGWSSQSKNVLEGYSPGTSRGRAIFGEIVRLVIGAAVVVSLKFVSRQTSWPRFYTEEGHRRWAGDNGPKWVDGMLYAWIYLVSAYNSIEASFRAVNILSLLLGSSVESVRPAGGDLSKMYTLRNCWGIVWHQALRRICTFLGRYLAHDLFEAPRGSFASKYVQLFAGFFVSATLHSSASMFLNRELRDNGEFKFYMLQAAMIMIEDHIIAAGKKVFGAQSSAFWTLFGYMWTLTWFGLSLQITIFPSFESGLSMTAL